MPDVDPDTAVQTESVSALLHSVSAEAELTGKISKLQRQQEKAAKAVRDYGAKLNTLYDDIRRSGHTADWILEAANITRQRELTERERFASELSSLRQKLLTHPESGSAERRALLEKSLEIGEAWIELPAQLHARLIALADERRALANKIRRAQPIQGEMQSKALSRQIIARFPNILAELAK